MRTAPTPCSGPGCAAVIRRRGWGFCRACDDRLESIFRRSHGPLDRDWSPARALFFGSRPASVAALAEDRMARP